MNIKSDISSMSRKTYLKQHEFDMAIFILKLSILKWLPALIKTTVHVHLIHGLF